MASRLCFVNEVVSWNPISSDQELQLKGTSQRGQEPLDTESEDATPLEAATKQGSEGSDEEHLVSVWFMECHHELCVKMYNKSDFQYKPRL
jgi:hypothetical protein